VKKKLIEIGFTEYEAKAYISLLLKNPVTAYEVAKNSLIPSSKIYEVLAKLTEKLVIACVEENQKKKYIPKDPDEMINSYKDRLNVTLEDLRVGLKSVSSDKDISYIWNVRDYECLINRSKSIIDNAQNSILVSIWPEEILLLKDNLKNAAIDKKVTIVIFGKADYKIGTVFEHPIEDTIYSEKSGRGLAIVIDSKEVLMGKIDLGNNVQGANSMNEGFVAMAEDYIKHDIYIMKIINRYKESLLDTFGENYYLLRDVFNDQDNKNNNY
jgi:sugar-specific transcriptional regulator TrmB